MNKILIVDDDRNLLQVIRLRLEAEGFEVTPAATAAEALEHAKAEIFALALIDLKLKDGSGIEVMAHLQQTTPELPVIILTAFGTIDSAVEAIQKGARSYVTKPFDYRDLLIKIRNCLEASKLNLEVKQLRNLVRKRYGFDGIIGNSEKMKKVLEQVGHAAATDSNVYIEGRSGTGKELIAKALHVASARSKGPFVAINCAAIPETLMESELFGHEKGAFTGANRTKKGLFAEAEGGSFFLDEIAEMPLAMQVKLLRALEEREFYPVGGNRSVKVDVRLIAAANRNLAAEVEKGNFREDLFYRIHVIPIKLPPLTDRKEDIPLLARHFLARFAQKMGKKLQGFTPEAMQKLLSHGWPGNIRELENTIECAVAMGSGEMITPDMLLQTRDMENPGLTPLKEAKDTFERDYLIQLIEITRGNISQAAKLAGKYRADFYTLLKKHQLDPTNFRPD
ncbi:MAG: sigma-54 dependent transcriptional regulator [Desulfobacterales bacterium]